MIQEHRIETKIPHDEWETMTVVVEQGPRDTEPLVEFTLDYDPKHPHRVKMRLSELEAAMLAVKRFQHSQAVMRGDKDYEVRGDGY